MLIQLPTETWIEILDWLNRRDMIKKLDQLWDRQFTTIVQAWLHRYTRNVKIRRLMADADGLHVLNRNLTRFRTFSIRTWRSVPIAQVEMPENITSFGTFIISPPHQELEPAMLAFLHRMRPLFRNVCLDINNGHGQDEMPILYATTIRNLMPLIIDQIETLILDHQCLQFLADNYLPFVRINAKVLCIWGYKSGQSELMINWLFNRRGDGQPRTFVGHSETWQPFDEFCTRVKERFLDPSRQAVACPFFVRWEDFATTPLVYENARTGERLISKQVEHGGKHYWLMVNYCPMNADMEWQFKKTAEVLDWDDFVNQKRKFFLDFCVPIVGPRNRPRNIVEALTDEEQQRQADELQQRMADMEQQWMADEEQQLMADENDNN